MAISRAWKRAALAGLVALALLGFAGARSASAQVGGQVIDCTNGGPGPNMTIQIYNNSPTNNIYPVLFAGTASAFDQWMAGCLKIPFNQSPDPNTLYPRASQYRMYVNCCATNENGIAPGGMVAMILPFYSPLVPPPIVAQPNPSKGEPIAQFIDWSTGAPPAGGLSTAPSGHRELSLIGLLEESRLMAGLLLWPMMNAALSLGP